VVGHRWTLVAGIGLRKAQDRHAQTFPLRGFFVGQKPYSRLDSNRHPPCRLKVLRQKPMDFGGGGNYAGTLHLRAEQGGGKTFILAIL